MHRFSHNLIFLMRLLVATNSDQRLQRNPGSTCWQSVLHTILYDPSSPVETCRDAQGKQRRSNSRPVSTQFPLNPEYRAPKTTMPCMSVTAGLLYWCTLFWKQFYVDKKSLRCCLSSSCVRNCWSAVLLYYLFIPDEWNPPPLDRRQKER